MQEVQEPAEIEHWKRISILGSGAFGIVSLWQNKITDDYIAIKKCKFQLPSHLSARQRERWHNEVQKMKTLNSPNIVSYKPIPQQLESSLQKYNPTNLPLLSMEYCTKGNLRHVLTQVKNLSGLQETDVKTALKDIIGGVSYLHNSNVTHRDIKPENIVLQQCDVRPGGVIYKLIDLGYAKELDDAIVSFVGTLHYLAPEIIKTQQYDFSVDYWSLGIMVFEIICGVLPFLPQYSPLQRFSYLEKKKSDQICIYQLHSGSVVYSSELLKENHISMCLQENLEIWLRHVLEFNPDLRKKNFPQDVSVFDYLLKILEKKIVTVFSIYTLEFYSYEIAEGTLMSTLRGWLERDTKIQKCDQVLLTNQLYDICDDQYVTDFLPMEDSTMYVFKKGVFINKDTFKLPKCVMILFENCNKEYKAKDLRLIYRKTLYFLNEEEKMLTYLKTSHRVTVCYIQKLNGKLKTNMQQVYKTVNNLLTRVDCYHNLHSTNSNLDNCNSVYKRCILLFQQQMLELEKCVHNANALLKRVDILCKRQIILEKVIVKVNPIVNNCDLQKEIDKAMEIISKCSDGQVMTPKEMVKNLSNALKKKDQLLNNKNFQNYNKAMMVAIKDVETLQSWMNNFHSSVNDLSKAIDDNQKEQYQSLFVHQSIQKSPKSEMSNSLVGKETDSVIQENIEMRCHLEDTLGEIFAAKRSFECLPSNKY